MSFQTWMLLSFLSEEHKGVFFNNLLTTFLDTPSVKFLTYHKKFGACSGEYSTQFFFLILILSQMYMIYFLSGL